MTRAGLTVLQKAPATAPVPLPAFLIARLREPRVAAWIVLSGALFLLLAALAFEHIWGLAPCELCLPQRGPPAAVIVIGAWAVACASLAPSATRFLLATAAVILMIGTAIAFYHVGVQEHWWPGPSACTGSGGFAGNAADLAASLKTTQIVRCDEAAWRMFGISLPGYNVLISTALSVIAVLPLWGRRKDPEAR